MKTKYVRLTSILLPVLMVIAALTACQKEAEPPPVAADTVTVDSVASEDGVMIYYDVRGTGDKNLIFVHCWSCDRDYWKNQVDEFAGEYRVVTIDLGGHGQSGLGRADWTMASFGADVAAVIQKLDLQNAILVGHSMGGPVIIEAARRLPGRVVALIGIDNFQGLHQSLTPAEVNAFLAQFQPDFAAATRQFVGAMFPAGADSALVAQTAEDMSSAPPEVAISAIRGVLLYNYAEALAEVRLPIRTISSDKYPTDVEGNRAIAASFDIKLLPGAGHFLHMEDPTTFNRLLHETLAEFWPPELE